MRCVKLIGVVAAVFLLSSPAYAGRVILSGHDADDHGNDAIYAGLFNDLLAAVTNGGSGILSIGADLNSKPANWIDRVARNMTTPQAVTYINDAAISTQSFAGFAILHIPSVETDIDGGITAKENNRLVARAADVADFVNGGGALFGLTQGDLFDAYGYLAPLGTITTKSVGSRGTFPSGLFFDDVTATAEGLAIGITDTNLDGCCWHDLFTSFPPFLEVLATANAPLDPGFHNVPAALGGTNVILTTDIPVGFDIHPTSCPNPLNPKSRGLMPAAIVGSATFDVTEVDVDTIRVLGVAPIRSAYEDVVAPHEPFSGKTDHLDCTTEGADGFLDLTLKFSLQAIIATLEADLGRPVENGEVFALPMTGETLGGTDILGEDVVIIRARGRR